MTKGTNPTYNAYVIDAMALYKSLITINEKYQLKLMSGTVKNVVGYLDGCLNYIDVSAKAHK